MLIQTYPFRDLDNLVMTPHVGYVTRDTYALWYGDVVEDIQAFVAGTPVRVIAAPAG